MQIGISTACFYPDPLESALNRIAALGFSTIEIFFNTESEYDLSFLISLRRCAIQNGIHIISIHPYTSLMEGMLLFSSYTRRTQDGLEQYRRYLHAAAYLGADYFTFHGERNQQQPPNMERTFEVYHQLCTIAKEEGVTIAQENVAWCRSENPNYLNSLAQAVPQLGYTLDFKQAYRAGHPWEEYLQVMQSHLCNIHLNDYNDSHSCLLPCDGVLDYQKLFHTLQEIGYDKHLLIEVYASNYTKDCQIAQAAHRIEQVMKHMR